MKKVLLLLSVVLIALQTSASDIVLRVILTDGTQNDYVVAERPQISFEDGKMTVVYRNMTTSYATADVETFIFTDLTSSIEQVKAGDTKLTFLENDNIHIEGVSQNEKIRVYAINGVQQQVNVKQTDKGCVVELSKLTKGQYIISISKMQSIKFIKK